MQDRRLGEVELWVHGERHDWMRAPDELLDCVVFLGVRSSSGESARYEVRGTAFFVSKQSAVLPDTLFVYLVTARHCVERAAQTGDNLWVRINTKTDQSAWVEVKSEWLTPDDPGADVAVLPFAPNDAVFKYKVIPEEMFVTGASVSVKDMGVGDDLLVTGLFTARAGSTRNLPIVRAGNLAAMPDEVFIDRDSGYPYDAYLAEMRSIGGLSGSPVFVIFGPIRARGGSVAMGGVEYQLLGIIRGHWDTKETDASDLAEAELRDVNMGIALVTPIYHALEVLNGKPLSKARRERETKLQADMALTKGSVGGEGGKTLPS